MNKTSKSTLEINYSNFWDLSELNDEDRELIEMWRIQNSEYFIQNGVKKEDIFSAKVYKIVNNIEESVSEVFEKNGTTIKWVDFISINWLFFNKNQIQKSFNYDEISKICSINDTRIPFKKEIEKLFEEDNIIKKLNIKEFSVWCKDENGNLFIAWFKNKCFCKTSKENKIYLLEVLS